VTPTVAGSAAAVDGDAPARVGPYVVLEQLGEGGMGAVYAAYHPELDRKVALKLLRAAAAAEDSMGQARLVREAQAMAKLSHENVVAVYDAGTYRNEVYLVMELVHGATLGQWLKEAARSWRQIVGVFRQAGRGLAAAHAAGLVHRDFKPANVLVSKSGRVQVADFGLARAPDASERRADEGELSPSSSGSVVTEAGTVVGTPAYISPEQLRGEAFDARSDQYSFCVALYEALYGARPRRDADGKLELPADAAGRAVPGFLRRAVLRGLADDPSARFASMDALLAELGRDPARTARRVAGAVLAVAVVAGALGFAARARRAPVPPGCDDPETALASVWNAARSGELARAFAASGKDASGEAARTTVRALDHQVSAWTAAHVVACERAIERGPDEAFFQTETCLTRQQMQLGAVIDVLLQADPDVVPSAAVAASSLLPPSRCEDPHVLASLPKPPSDPKLRAEVELLRIRLAAANAFEIAGQAQRARDRLLPLVERAHAAAYPPLVAEVALALGITQVELGEPLLAEDALRQAERAGEVAGMDLVASEAASVLAWVSSHGRSDLAAAQPWLDRARVELDRAGGSPLEEARLENALTVVADQKGDDVDVIRHAERAFELRRQVLGPAHPLTLAYMNNLVGFYDLNGCRYDRAVAVARVLVAETAKTLGTENVRYASALNALADNLAATGHLDEADRALDEATRILIRIGGHDGDLGRALLGTRLDLYYEQGHFEESLAMAQRYVDISRDTYGEDSAYRAYSQQSVGIALEGLGRHAEALQVLEASDAALAKVQGDTALGLVQGLEADASALLGLGQPERALASAEHALAIFDKHCPPPGWKAWGQFLLARALVELHRDPARVRELVRQARAELTTFSWQRWQLAAVDDWLRAHPEAAP
jgi:tRNA A-37 threonylcarbamoyl transferase component Bud32/tetratricopeptide (TPR) repeat protein